MLQKTLKKTFKCACKQLCASYYRHKKLFCVIIWPLVFLAQSDFDVLLPDLSNDLNEYNIITSDKNDSCKSNYSK